MSDVACAWVAKRVGEIVQAVRLLRFETIKEGHMCPACFASTAVMVAGAGSSGGILALCIAKFSKFFRASRRGLFQKTREE